MSNQYILNLSYKSPQDDFQEHLGINTDCTINIKYTLLSMRNMLQQNVEVLNKLIDNCQNINSIVPISNLELLIDCETNVSEYLLNNNVLISTDIPQEQYTLDHNETNEQRLNLIYNLTNINESDGIFSTSNLSDSDSECESDELVSDKRNLNNLISKYDKIIQSEYCSDSD